MTNFGIAFMGSRGVQRLDAAVGSTSTSFSYPISAASNRALCVVVSNEGADPLGSPSVSWGGQSLTQMSAPDVGSPDANKAATFWLSDAKIVLGSGTTLSVSGTAGDVGVSVASYFNCSQSAPTNKDVAENNSSTPIQLNITTANPGSLVFAGATAGTSASATWSADMTEQTDINPTGMGSTMADALVPGNGVVVSADPTFSSQNRAVGAAFEVEVAT